MNDVPIDYALILSAVLMLIGAVGVLARRNLVFVLMSLEIMLSSAGIALVAAASKWRQPDGQVFVIFIFVVAAAEVGVGLSLVLRVYHHWKSVDSDEASSMRG